jgi:hypothetical protein
VYVRASPGHTAPAPPDATIDAEAAGTDKMLSVLGEEMPQSLLAVTERTPDIKPLLYVTVTALVPWPAVTTALDVEEVQAYVIPTMLVTE